MSHLPKAGVFLIEGESLNLITSAGPGPEIEGLCSKDIKNCCLADKAIELKRTVHTSCVDDSLENSSKDMRQYGQYDVPMIDAKVGVVGVIVLYLPPGHKRDNAEIKFMESCADIMLGIIRSHRSGLKIISAKQGDAISAMVATYNHELNNPLAIALSSLKQARSGRNLDKNLDRIERSLGRVTVIVKKISTLNESSEISFEEYSGDSKMVKVS